MLTTVFSCRADRFLILAVCWGPECRESDQRDIFFDFVFSKLSHISTIATCLPLHMWRNLGTRVRHPLDVLVLVLHALIHIPRYFLLWCRLTANLVW